MGNEIRGEAENFEITRQQLLVKQACVSSLTGSGWIWNDPVSQYA